VLKTGAMKPRIVLVDDERNLTATFSELLADEGYEVTTFADGADALVALESNPSLADAVVTDVAMPRMDGLELCAKLRESRPELPVIITTGDSRIETSVAALRAGAYDFLAKPVHVELLVPCVARAVERHRLTQELSRRAPASTASGPLLFGESPPMVKVNDLIARVAPSGASVLVFGETGTGKELVARALHALSPRAKAPFVAINCAALPASLVESELFGYAKGAFTDARAARAGLFSEADAGTLFLDEVAELSLDNQAKLLRALQERKVRPLGSNSEVPFDARVICATHRDLEAEVEAGRFRQDLFFRINVIRIDLPPLRERGNDVIHLAKLFLKRVCERDARPPVELGPDVARKLLAYKWPGNVRELENCVERLAALARGALAVGDLPEKVRSFTSERFQVTADEAGEVLPLDQLERRYILQVLKLANDNRSRAAELLQIDRGTLQRKLKAWGVTEGQAAEPAAVQLPP